VLKKSVSALKRKPVLQPKKKFAKSVKKKLIHNVHSATKSVKRL